MINKAVNEFPIINDISITEAVIHVLDTSLAEPILNDYKIELTDSTYKFLYKHIEKAFKSEKLKLAKFEEESNKIKDITQQYLNGEESDLVTLSKKIASQLFATIQFSDIPSCDLIVASICTDIGPMIAILKVDYANTFTHSIDMVEDKIGIKLIEHQNLLRKSSQMVEKAAFIKLVRSNNDFDLMIIDNIKRNKEEYVAQYWQKQVLSCYEIENNRKQTKSFINSSETWTRNNVFDAERAEKIRSTIKDKLVNEDYIDIQEVSQELFSNDMCAKEEFVNYIFKNGIAEKISVDKKLIQDKFKRLRLNIDNEIDLYINHESYKDNSKFEIVRNGDGSINMIIKNVVNYIEKV